MYPRRIARVITRSITFFLGCMWFGSTILYAQVPDSATDSVITPFWKKADATATEWTIPLRIFTPTEDPYNPDIEYEHPQYNQLNAQQEAPVTSLVFKQRDDKLLLDWQINFAGSKSILIEKVRLDEFVPTVPKHLQTNEYLTSMALITQERTRQTVWFDSTQINGMTLVNCPVPISRIGLTNNELGLGYWELEIWTPTTDSTESVWYHGWFAFPEVLYVKIFQSRNGLDFRRYKQYLNNGFTPDNAPFQLEGLRKVVVERPIEATDLTTEPYRIGGDFRERRKNIIKPARFRRMSDLQTDSTTFSSFITPGLYERGLPKRFQLSRLHKLERAVLRKTESQNEKHELCAELELDFVSSDTKKHTRLLIGGLNTPDKQLFFLLNLPLAPPELAQLGKQIPMGIGCHFFSETYLQQRRRTTYKSPTFAVMLDEKGKWLDNRQIGIDGLLLHLDNEQANLLHVWVLATGRTAPVGHYTLQLR